MTARDLASLVTAYFAVADYAAHKRLLGVLADAVEEAGADAGPLREPSHTLYCRFTESGQNFDLTFHTVAELEAYVNGSADEDDGYSTVQIYRGAGDREADEDETETGGA